MSGDSKKGSSDYLNPPGSTTAASSSSDTAFDEKSNSTENNGDPSGLKRERWATRFDFVLACIGWAIGYGNVWRFPYLVYKNGGGAFLIPFIFSAIVGGLPVFFLEVVQGQFMSAGALQVWKMSPLFQGIGFASMMILFMLNCYYNILLTWSLRYFFASFTWELPWQSCTNDWNTDACTIDKPTEEIDSENTTWYRSSRNVTFANLTQLTDPAIEYWENRVLDISDGIEEIGEIQWELAVCLLLAWAIVFVCIFNGIRSSGRVMYVTATAPILLIFVLMIRGVTLPGAAKGLEFYLKPDINKLTDLKVWADAGTQIFFSYAIGFGVHNALGSFNPWRQNTFRDSYIFSIIDTFVCIAAVGSIFYIYRILRNKGFVIFPVLGHMSEIRGVPIDEVAEQGPGLVFVIYPKAVSLMPWAPVWAVLFFSMLILIGIDSQFCAVEGFITAITDFFPSYLTSTIFRRAGFVGAVCLINFFLGLTMVTQGGMYIFQILDYYSGCRIIMLVTMAECLVVGWVYGIDRFTENISMMWGRPLSPVFRLFLKIMWNYVTPIYVFALFLVNCYEYSQDLTYKRSPTNTYEFPTWAVIFGWFLAYISVICIPIVAGIKICKLPKAMTILQRIKYLTKPVLKPYMVLPDESVDNYILEDDDSNAISASNDTKEVMCKLMLEDRNDSCAEYNC